LKTIRIKLGLSQEEFARKLGIAQSAVAMYEIGERTPRDEIKKKIAIMAKSKIDPIFFED
ncbi:MAG: helix-turn-helix transcriptional regulator, partial [Allobaculum sp.]|nr:helix-turn-helix transcriptional regulator [Allobaculum sp.]